MIFIWSWAAQAIPNSSQQASIDKYISQRRIQEFTQKAADLEPKVNDVDVYLTKRTAEISKIIGQLNERMKDFGKDKPLPSPYLDEAWKAEARNHAVQLCCEIKADPNRQKAIQQRVASGLPPLILPKQSQPRGQPKK